MAGDLDQEFNDPRVSQARMQGPAEDYELPELQGQIRNTQGSIADLEADSAYAERARIVYDYLEGRRQRRKRNPITGKHREYAGQPVTEQEYSQWLSERYAWFNNNVASMLVNWKRFEKMPGNVALAFLEGLEAYDAAGDYGGMEPNLNAAAATIADPLNYAGFAVMGKMGVIQGTKALIKSHLRNLAKRWKTNQAKRPLTRAAIGGTFEGSAEGAAMGNVEVGAREELHERAGSEMSEEEKTGIIAGHTIAGGLMSGGMATGAEAVAKKMRKKGGD